MNRRTLGIVTTAYRATLEEQDDPVLWLLSAMRSAGADVDVVLAGNAVTYLVRGQDASGLAFGERRQTHPPRLDEDVARLSRMGARVLVVEDDLDERGIAAADLIDGATPITRRALPTLCAAYDHVWHF